MVRAVVEVLDDPWPESLVGSADWLMSVTATLWSSGLTANPRIEAAPAATVLTSVVAPLGASEWMSVSPSR